MMPWNTIQSLKKPRHEVEHRHNGLSYSVAAVCHQSPLETELKIMGQMCSRRDD